ncbi:hypothetical protein TSOC_010804 [Tetrabaena socialis]|uniref:Uncharacterized protein n=1 Tax=Tetrabaena socialis TaxID=47790 RepID=A0A2J7ZSB7_9CHLO|nr:hypothetical protein TSOC_010804 [Tetrabaena socialis]|eukprot:PNH03169.1 hypothetical protein TSOC_010804 [Tetrabaena socialis]
MQVTKDGSRWTEAAGGLAAAVLHPGRLPRVCRTALMPAAPCQRRVPGAPRSQPLPDWRQTGTHQSWLTQPGWEQVRSAPRASATGTSIGTSH